MNTLDFMKQVVYEHTIKRVCRVCSQEKFLYKLAKNHDSLFGRDLLCKECDQARMAARRQPNRDKTDKIKDVPCVDCGGKFPPECMDFDHLPGFIKSFKISAEINRTWSKIEAEIAKCEIVCSNCHRIRTKLRKKE